MRAWYFGNVPIEGVEGVEKDKEQPVDMSMMGLYRSRSYALPQTKQACFSHPKIVRICPTLECAQDNDWKSTGIFQSIC